MTPDQQAMETLLSSNLEQATWALSRICESADHINIVAEAFARVHTDAAVLAIYRHLGSNPDVDLLGIVTVVREEIRKVSNAVKEQGVPGLEAMPGFRMPQGDSEQRDPVLGPFSDGAAQVASAYS